LTSAELERKGKKMKHSIFQMTEHMQRSKIKATKNQLKCSFRRTKYLPS